SFGADHVMLFTGGLPQGDRDLAGHRARLEEMLAGLLGHARACGVKLALEPLHPMLCGDRTILTSLSEANDLCDRLGQGIGVVVDVYHVWWDARLEHEIARAGEAGRILGFHVNDWLVPTRDILRDRGMMGDGVIDIPPIRRKVEAQGFDGFHEVEIFSKDNWWKRDIDDVLSTCIERHQTCC
ncbi:MAG: sugar phosphate isomerase/epimerase, partial [Geminicoccaceae bacterium]|nr:sugar phosphate isomerase/epimerase [Geminicoccaceae bacterium]